MSDNHLTQESVSRRQFLKGSTAAMGGLMVGAWLPPFAPKSAAAAAVATQKGALGDRFAKGFGAFVRVGHDGRVAVISPKIEMGQGIHTGIAMMVAEELEVGLDQIDLQEAPPDAELYTDTLLQFQATGGSTSTRYTWEPLRRAGATARILLVEAAASVWKVEAGQCQARDGQVLGPDGQALGYGKLVDLAATYPLPETVELKQPDAFRLIGTPAQRLDTPAKVNGEAKFTIDLDVPGMLITSARACPVYGGTVRQVSDRAARAIPGVKDVVVLENAVAVTARIPGRVLRLSRPWTLSGTTAPTVNSIPPGLVRNCTRLAAVMGWWRPRTATLTSHWIRQRRNLRPFMNSRFCPIPRLSR